MAHWHEVGLDCCRIRWGIVVNVLQFLVLEYHEDGIGALGENRRLLCCTNGLVERNRLVVVCRIIVKVINNGELQFSG